MSLVRLLSLPALALAAAGCMTTPTETADHPEARPYGVTADPMAQVDSALARAAARNTRVLLVLGANWCHDSRAFAGWLETPRFAALVEASYELVYVNVGMPQTGDGHNLDVARRFGLEAMPGTPAVLVIRPDGSPVNADSAASWRNAASRSEDAIFSELTALADQK